MIDELQKSKYTQKDLALKFNVTQKTLSKYLKELQNNFPKNNSLFRYLGKRQYFLEKDVNIILKLFSMMQKNKMQKND